MSAFFKKKGGYPKRDNRDNSYGSSRGGNRGGSNSGYADRGRQETFSAICHECNKKCDVPFKPTGSKPVLCRQCFRRDEGGNSGYRNSKDFSRGKPKSNRYDRGSSTSGSNEEIMQQLKKLNKKMDILLDLLDE